MRALADVAEDAGVVLLHENEKDIYGDTPEPLPRHRRVGRLAAAAGGLGHGQLRAGRRPALHRGLRDAAPVPGVHADQGRARGRRDGAWPPARATASWSRPSPPCATTASTASSRSSRTSATPRARRLLRPRAVRPGRRAFTELSHRGDRVRMSTNRRGRHRRRRRHRQPPRPGHQPAGDRLELAAVVDPTCRPRRDARRRARRPPVRLASPRRWPRRTSTSWSVCTPTGAHGEVAIEALAAGKHVIIEKPAEIDRRAARRDHRGPAARPARS